MFSHMGSWLKVMDDIIADKSKREELENQLNRMKFLAALQPYKSSCPRMEGGCKNIFQLFSLVIKTKLVQNVNRMSERHAGRQTERQIDFSA